MIDKDLKVIIKGTTYRYGNLPENLRIQHAKEIEKALEKETKILKPEFAKEYIKKPFKKGK